MGGLDFLCKLRADHHLRRQKVNLCSRANDRATIAHTGSLGVEGYLVKPFTAWGFLELVNKVCESGQGQMGIGWS